MLCTGLVAAPFLPARPDTLLTFGLDQTFTYGRNEDLEVPAAGSSSLSSTRLSFGLVSETPIDRFRIDGRTQYRFGTRDGESVSEFEEPFLSFSYNRDGADSGFDIRGSFRRSQEDFNRNLDDFLNEEGVLELPVGFEDFSGEGVRTDYNASTRLVLGREAAPAGVTLELGIRGVDYSDGADDPDEETIFGSSVFRLRLSPVFEGRIRYRYSRYTQDDVLFQERRHTHSVQAGGIYSISPVTSLDVGLGYTRIDSNIPEDRERGINARFDLGRELPDGAIGISLNVDQTTDGQEGSLVLRRSLELPDGSLSGRIGASRLRVSGDVTLIGGLDWTRTLPTGRVSLGLDRSLIGDDELRYRTTLFGNYTHDINEVSSVALRIGYVHRTETEDSNRIEQFNVGATYSHQLTRDWSLNTGVTYRVRDEANVGRATSPAIFIGIGRQFQTPL
jgi:hypothetical protein